MEEIQGQRSVEIRNGNYEKATEWRRKKESNSKRAFRKKEKETFGAILFLSNMEVLMVLKGDDDTQSHKVPANTNPAPNQTAPPQSFASSWAGRGGGWGEQRGVDESLSRPEEGHTGAMAIPKTTYLLSHNDSACQNNCQDT